ncbi:hypothetical protein Z043_100811 [Scleropages formosus]|uniref:BPTI/Kunitz inhibitor domain-containing protein n=1 Tax=Scleropages formosus TaxID=113540 RepID=A0A0P7XW31_SCLFO|nr:hypothetical protein Z043_100811 [Scleropages formosus]
MSLISGVSFVPLVIDLLEALNITRSIKGVTKAKGLEPGAPAWKFRHRAPHFTLPHDFSIYFLSTMQGSIGLHFVAQQAKNSDGTLISLVSPAAMKEDGRPLLRLVSSTRSNQLRLDYRAAHSMQPSSFVFPGGTPFANGRWARMALSLEAHKVSLFIDCEEAVMFQKSHGEDVLSLVLPIDLEITMASMPGDKASKFLGYLQTAEVSTTGYQRRPWRCENLSDPLPFSTLSEQLVDPVMEDTGEGDPRIHLEPQSDVAHDQPQRSPLGPPGSQGRFRAVASSEEDRLRRLEGLVEGLSSMVEMLKTQACFMPKMAGHCRTKRDAVSRWFYNSVSASCEEFLYSGCGGNGNNFESQGACQQQCMLGACCIRLPRHPGLLVGFDREGYDRHGYNASNLDRGSHRRKVESQVWTGPALFGLNGEVFSGLSDGRRYDKYGYDQQGYDKDGFHRDTGFNLTGYNRKGEHDDRSEFGLDGYNWDGYDRAGFDCSGQDSHGYNYLGTCTGFTYRCEYVSRAQCQLRGMGGPNGEVMSFSLGRRCGDLLCGDGCGCSHAGHSYRFGQSFEHGCEVCLCSFTGSVECTCRHVSQRKEVRDLTPTERELYQQAIRKLYSKQGIS